jgi:hypothetical protein
MATPDCHLLDDGQGLMQVVFAAPDKWITANQRLTHWAHAHRVRTWRTATATYARHLHLPHLQRARIHVLCRIAGPRRNRDRANWHPTVKPIIDGLVDHGLLPNDDDTHLDGPYIALDQVTRYGPKHGAAGQVVVTITDLGGAP